MKRIKFLKVMVVSLLWLFIFYNLADAKMLSEISREIDLQYKEVLSLKQQGRYIEAKKGLNKIIKTLDSDPYLESWRRVYQKQPTKETVYAMFKVLEGQPQGEQGVAFKGVEQQRQREEITQREERINQFAELKAKKQAEHQTHLKQEQKPQGKWKELLLSQKEERRKALAEEKQKMQAEAKKKKQEEALKKQQELKAKQEELVRRAEERKKQIAEKEAQLKAERERLAQEKEAKLKQRQEQRKLEAEKRAQERQQAEVTRQQKLAEEKAKAEEERQARLKTEKEKQRQEKEAQLQAKREKLAQQRQQELARQQEELQAKLKASMKSIAQEKAITEAMLKKQRRDQAKIKKIEELWIKSRRLYEQGMYAEAIKGFEEVIKLEGNPRIKYTPFAKEYIEKAKNNLIQKKKVTLYKDLEQIEKEMVNEVLKQQVPPYIEPPQRIEQREPTPLIEPPELRKKLKATKITMDFDKVGLKSVIAFLSQESGINFVASQKVLELALVVSARFKETSLDEAIKYITKNLGLVYRIDKEIVWVAHPEEIANEPMETRVYYLNRGGGLFTEFSPMSAGTTETGLGGSSAQISKVYTIEDTLKEVIPWPSDSKLSYDKRINALIVRNTPQNLQMLEDMLYSLDVEPLQVLIEARFLEVDITDTKELGLDWNLASGDYALKQRDGVYKKGIGSGSGVDFTAFTRAAEGLNLTYKGMLTNSQFQAVLHALEETKKIKTLSSPRITTLNNQLATMKVVDEWIYPTRYEYEIVQFDLNGDGDFSDAGETTYKNVPKDFLRRDVGILLKVIPAVGADKKTISLSLIPEVSEGTADGFSYTGEVTLPKFTSRNLSTTVIVNSGETVVLGGMIKESRTKTITRVPLLGNIPLLGAFFRKNTDSIERKNLLIFVTAKVLSPSGEEVIVAQK